VAVGPRRIDLPEMPYILSRIFITLEGFKVFTCRTEDGAATFLTHGQRVRLERPKTLGDLICQPSSIAARFAFFKIAH
jgi:hypothetical protein